MEELMNITMDVVLCLLNHIMRIKKKKFKYFYVF